MFFKIVVLIALAGIIAESKVIHRRDVESVQSDAVVDAVRQEVTQLESVNATNQEQVKLIAKAILQALKNLNEKILKVTSKASKPVQQKRSTEEDEDKGDKANCCG